MLDYYKSTCIVHLHEDMRKKDEGILNIITVTLLDKCNNPHLKRLFTTHLWNVCVAYNTRPELFCLKTLTIKNKSLHFQRCALKSQSLVVLSLYKLPIFYHYETPEWSINLATRAPANGCISRHNTCCALLVLLRLYTPGLQTCWFIIFICHILISDQCYTWGFLHQLQTQKERHQTVLVFYVESRKVLQCVRNRL